MDMMAAKNHSKRDTPMLCVLANTMDAEVKIPVPVQIPLVRMAVLCLGIAGPTNHAVEEQTNGRKVPHPS